MNESRRLHWSRARCGSAVFHTLEARERTNLSRHDYTLGRACIYSLSSSSAQWGPQTPQATPEPEPEPNVNAKTDHGQGGYKQATSRTAMYSVRMERAHQMRRVWLPNLRMARRS